ncbi:MAG: tRNA (N(6)-L-threonylcarbamoyladenosine(37)-C(2))-methylthiotransferase MtaB [Bdellovibrionales bacterium]
MDRLKYNIHTFGCKVNTYDSGLLTQRFEAKKSVDTWTNPEKSESKIHILNTCAVTSEATKEAVKLVRRLKSKDPFCTVVVTGCAAQVDTDQFSSLPGVDLVVANSHKGQIENLIEKYFKGQLQEKVFKSLIFKKDDLEAGGGLEEDHTRSFLKIQDGCNSFCTFCVIPFARGKSRSIPIADLVSRANALYEKNIREVVLTGVHIGDYQDQTNTLEDLVEILLLKTKIPRFRLSSLEPIELTPRLLELYRDPRLCTHFHMSIQSANTKVLRDMKRQYSAEQVEEALKAIATQLPHAFVGMDVIAGFPGETEEDFLDTYQRLHELPWTRLHVFPYSQRPGTLALRLPNPVEPAHIKERARRLRELSYNRFVSEAEKQVGTVKWALPLKDSPETLAQSQLTTRTLTRDYWPVIMEEPIQMGEERSIKITGHRGFEKGEFSGRLTAISL